MVKPEVVRNLINRLEENLSKLRELALISQEEFLRDFTKLESAKYLLQVSIPPCAYLYDGGIKEDLPDTSGESGRL